MICASHSECVACRSAGAVYNGWGSPNIGRGNSDQTNARLEGYDVSWFAVDDANAGPKTVIRRRSGRIIDTQAYEKSYIRIIVPSLHFRPYAVTYWETRY